LRLVVRRQPPQQPDHLEVATGLALQAAARLDPIEIAVDVELEQRRGMIAGPAGRCRLDVIEAHLGQVERVDERIHRANRIALVNPIIEAFRQQR
jgi:hypothetical protein